MFWSSILYNDRSSASDMRSLYTGTMLRYFHIHTTASRGRAVWKWREDQCILLLKRCEPHTCKLPSNKHAYRLIIRAWGLRLHEDDTHAPCMLPMTQASPCWCLVLWPPSSRTLGNCHGSNCSGLGWNCSSRLVRPHPRTCTLLLLSVSGILSKEHSEIITETGSNHALALPKVPVGEEDAVKHRYCI
ncbi:uncharacterized protein LAESUDRAFT_234311 [Laetiporus sulphureus 93-53]|uniref:Uncharacterized protein n=1 Tax=Laetiporus sulphureus 93-53 TaxID=1314785 RepID=A0A165DMT9_9APHY|nr:uncharacterized protein LAESUDRAFT_234311 [Laetiporus sulphureus 93-53]KZT05223.1 hypothetical protein LAESUDRAFT_234311 [Laetiporus sulphureus 93-53]